MPGVLELNQKATLPGESRRRTPGSSCISKTSFLRWRHVTLLTSFERMKPSVPRPQDILPPSLCAASGTGTARPKVEPAAARPKGHFDGHSTQHLVFPVSHSRASKLFAARVANPKSGTRSEIAECDTKPRPRSPAGKHHPAARRAGFAAATESGAVNHWLP